MAEVVHNDRQIVRFYEEAVLDMALSEKAQRPIFKDMTLCEIKWVGSRLQSTIIPAHEKFRPRRSTKNMKGLYGFEKTGGMESPAEAFPEEWAAFQGLTTLRQGTVLERMGLSKAKIAELNYMNIHTVEQLASLGDNGIAAIGPGGRALVEQAKAWVAETTDKEAAAAALAEKAAMEERIAKLEAALAGQTQAKIVDDFDAMDDDQLKAFIVSKGGNPRANAAREKLLQACRELAEFAA